MRGTRLLRNLTLMAALGILGSRPVLANCDAAQENCSSSCSSMATAGFIVGMAGALNRNNSAYQSGQRDMQNAQACYNRCQAQYQSCSRQEQAAQQRHEAQRRAQQQQIEAQQQRQEAERQAQQRAQAEREALRQRVNRVISPPVLPAPKIKDAAPLLLEAQAHEKDNNPAAAAYIYKLVLQGAAQPRHQQAARSALKRYALEELTDVGTHKPATYAMTLDAYEPLGVFSPAERAQLAAMAPEADDSENTARDYLRKNPKGTLRELAQAMLTAVPGWRLQRAEAQKQEEEARLQQIRTAPKDEQVWVRTKEGCLLYHYMAHGILDITWSGPCQDSRASGTGTYQQLGADGVVLYQYDGPLVAGKPDGFAKVVFLNERYEGDYRNGQREGRGKFYWKDGVRYEGDLRDNKITGQGTYWWPDGGRYQGTLVDGKFVGQGTLWYATGDYFVGEWANNQQLNGTLYWSDGRVKAVFTNGQRSDR